MSFNSVNLNLYVPLSNLLALQNSQLHDLSEISPQSQGSKLSTNSKKILKKRTKYNKITDEIRLKLIEAVEKNGEILKSAAKRFKVNYSSAKSIFQTYRKEGRVLRKTSKSRRTPPRENSEGDEIPALKIHSYSPIETPLPANLKNCLVKQLIPNLQENHPQQKITIPTLSLSNPSPLHKLTANLQALQNNANYNNLKGMYFSQNNILPLQSQLKRELSTSSDYRPIPPFNCSSTSLFDHMKVAKEPLRIPPISHHLSHNFHRSYCQLQEASLEKSHYSNDLKLALDGLMRKLAARESV